MRRQVNRSVVTDTAFLFFVRYALIRTLDGSAFDPVHCRIRRGRCYLLVELFMELSVAPVQASVRSRPDGTSKNI